MAHQLLSAVAYHAAQLPLMILKFLRLLKQSICKSNYTIDRPNHVVADGCLVLSHDPGPFILNVQFLLCRDVLKTDDVVRSLASRELHLL